MNNPYSDDVTILIVDDTPMNIDLLASILGREGKRIEEANNGKKALEMVELVNPDLILLDIMMPIMDGYTVCEILKANEATRDIPVIFISALDNINDIVRAFEVGGVDYITKPFQAQEVRARVKSQLTLVRQRRQIDEQYRHELEAYHVLDEMKEQFIYSATHDLKNPLNIIMGYVNLLEMSDGAGFEEHGKDFLAAIQRGVVKMQILIKDMLDLAKAQTSSNLLLASVSVNDLLKTCFKDFEMAARDKGIQFSITPLTQDRDVWIDKDSMARVLENLISNAIKYTPSGGAVEVRAELREGNAIIEVADTGLGIPAADIPHLFDPFFRVRDEAHASIEGTGIGLSIVKSIIEQHKGSITVESENGKGSVFRVSLPT